ncbi:hypothetical protein JTE90_015413 [Oedothorax gibbosus]|uniref:Disks large-associated protein 1 n=1 Tax=Oedothorax gibbosus TaxID=931172 RepID=A0AAV6U8P3_9ARAC|nr:hypothetical protein JTE90_015413 [Oedothorax gibbosus]
MMNLMAEDRNKPHSASFSSLQTNEKFQHFRSVSYFEAVTNASNAKIRNSTERPKAARMPSNSTPCTPKKIEIEKYSTLPIGNGISFPSKKTRSSSLSSFFRKFKPKFHRSSSDSKNPWIVIEFAPHSGDTDDNSSDSDKSDRSIEQAVQSKAQHFTSLKDLHQGHHHSNDPCNCPLRKDNSPRSFSRTSMNNSTKFKSETSLFFRLSPRRRIENFKHILKSLSSKRRRFRTSTSLHSLSGRSCAYIGVESYLKSDGKSSGGALPSFGQVVRVEHDRASSPVFQFCRPPRQDNLRSLRHSADISYLLKIPNSKSSNASLSSVLEDSTLLPKRAQPPSTLSLGNQDQRIHHKMASVESIGACSLDFDASGADFGKDLTASECTLHSNGDLEVDLVEQRESLDKLKLNGFKPIDQQECTVAEIKLPSYVSISCAINGYPNFSRFCRSRDNSPARSSFRKSSLEPSMLAHGSRKEAYEAHRYSRSQSDCNGSVFTESKRVTVSKQITIPLQSFKKYTTEVTFSSNGTTTTLEEEKTVVTNGHETTTRVLAKEVGTDGTKSLVQQRIESLYGKSVSEEVHIRKGKEAQVNGDGSITDRSPTPNGKNHIGSVSPPVFRHLNKDFRKQLQINIPKKSDADKTKSKLLSKELLSKKENGFPPISNGHDECDRIKSLTPPPLKSKSIIEEKAPDTPTKDDSEGYRFLNLIDVEKEKIQGQVRSLEEELAVNSASIPEEALGKIRAACGKANLLITQKFEQFRGLCWKHIEENPSVPFYTTATDLAGFWDLVMLQVDDINATFKEINAMQKNGWKEVVCEKPTTQVTKIRHSNPNGSSKSNPSTPKKSAKSAELSKAREEARRQLLAAKKKGRQQAAAKEDEDIAIFAPPSS